MTLPKPRVVLFGAGATRAAFADQTPPPPVDSDFFEIAAQVSGRGTGRLARKVVRDVFDLYGIVTGIGLEEYYRDIETRLELSQFAKTKNRPKDWKARARDLEELVRRVLIHTTCRLDRGSATPHNSEIHSAVLKRLHAGDTLITFNYDTVIEESAPQGRALWTPKGGYGVEVSGVTHEWTRNWFARHNSGRAAATQIQLLKLHGSLNWVLYKNSKVRLKPRPYVIRSRNGKPVFDRAAIVPPGWHKRVDRAPYNALWRSARLKLESCATLVAIGYSLPDTDLMAKALFLEAVRLRQTRRKLIKELHVADTSNDARKRIVEMFAPALGATGLVFRYGSATELKDAWKS